MHTDPIADMLTRIRNGQAAHMARVDVPRSKVKVKIAEILKAEGFIDDFREISDKLQGILEIKLRYDTNRQPAIQSVQRFSRPGLRRYFGVSDIPKVRNGLGIMIMSTSHGLMTDRAARENNVGGEALCTVY